MECGCGHQGVLGVWSHQCIAYQWCCPPLLCAQVVLEDFTLELPAGQVTALCGLSGAGEDMQYVVACGR